MNGAFDIPGFEEAGLREFLLAMPHGVLVTDLNGTVIFCNSALAEMQDCAVEELVGKKSWELLADDLERAAMRRYFDALVAEQTDLRSMVFGLGKKGGEEVLAEVDWTYRRDAAGRVIGLIAVLTDITRRREAEERSRRASERYHQLFEDSPVMHLVTRNKDGVPVIEHCNRHLLRTLGYALEELVGRSLADLYTPESRQAMVDQGGYARALAGEFLSEERQLYARGGRVVETLLRAVPETNSRGEVVGTRAMFVDVTEQRMLQKQLHHAAKMEALGRLAGGIAHDFNNLLTVIGGFARLQLSRTETEDGRMRLNEIQKAADRGGGLTRQLLAFTRQQDLEREALDINRVVADIEGLLRRTLGDDVELRMDLASAIRSISANRGQIEQILVNLAINARDAMPRGGRLTITTAMRALPEPILEGVASPGGQVMLSISDSGIGVREEILGKIFDPFFTTKSSGQGTGLGLSIVYGIVRRYDGHIEVRSRLGQGTRFDIYFPATDEEAVCHGAEAELEEGPPAGRGTVLAVEDHPDVRRLIVEVLEEEGFEVLVADTAEGARRLYEEASRKVDLLLSDVQLPEATGRELADFLRASEALHVLLISGHDPDTSSEEEPELSGYPFLRKPFDGPTLVRRIRELLGDSEPERSHSAN